MGRPLKYHPNVKKYLQIEKHFCLSLGWGFSLIPCNQCGRAVVRASESRLANLGSIQLSSNSEDYRTVFTVFLRGAQHIKWSVEKEPASVPVVFLRKALNRIPPSLDGKHDMRSNSLPVTVGVSFCIWINGSFDISQTKKDLIFIEVLIESHLLT